MIAKVSVASFKSLEKLDIELGQLNVFVGANGSGKSNLLEAIGVLSAAAVSGFCKELWEHEGRPRAFVDAEGVGPTSDAAERSPRHAVIWREPSFGTQSASGSRFVGRNVLARMTEAAEARLSGRPCPSLGYRA